MEPTTKPNEPTPPTDAAEPEETVIERQSRWLALDYRELWRYRELLLFLTWRDIKVRYKQTVLGAAWAVLQPFAMMVVFTVFMSERSEVDSELYPLFAFCGLTPWFFFSNSITNASQSIVANQSLVTKIYFPRFYIPLAAVGACLLDFVIAGGMLWLMLLYYNVVPGWGMLVSLLAMLGLTVAAMGAGTMLSALTVAYRDFRYVVPFMVQFWMFSTPTLYMNANEVLSSQWRYILPINPAHGLIAAFRAGIMGGPIDGYALGVSWLVSLSILIFACYYFRRVERSFADII